MPIWAAVAWVPEVPLSCRDLVRRDAVLATVTYRLAPGTVMGKRADHVECLLGGRFGALP